MNDIDDIIKLRLEAAVKPLLDEIAQLRGEIAKLKKPPAPEPPPVPEPVPVPPAPAPVPVPVPGPTPAPPPHDHDENGDDIPPPAPSPVPSPSPEPTPVPAPVAAGFLSILSPEYEAWFGPGIQYLDALGYPTQVGVVGGRERIIGLRMISPVSGHLESVRFCAEDKADYAKGTGGIAVCSVYLDNGRGQPNMAARPLATGRLVFGGSGGEYPNRGYAFEMKLASLTPIQRGQIPHFVFTNADGSPSVNLFTVQIARGASGQGRRPSRFVAATERGVYAGTRAAGSGAAFTFADHTEVERLGTYSEPQLQVRMRDGQVWGIMRCESGNVHPSRTTVATSAKPVRERFKLAKAETVRQFSLMTAAAVAGPLKWEWKRGSDVLAWGVISQAAANFRTQTFQGKSFGLYKDYDIVLPKPLALPAGVEIDLDLTPQAGGQWVFGATRSGKEFGGVDPATWTQSQAFRYDGIWTPVNYWNAGSMHANWRVMLQRAA